MSIILKTTNLCKSFSRQTVVNNISLNIEKNSVYGLLGPNGAGKSTTLKMITGILKPTSGSIEFDGHAWHRKDLNDIGTLIETPPLYENLTAFENLKVRTELLGLPDKRCHEALDIVGLTNTGKKRAGQFSLGMKQRLGIAIAILNNPRLLILDEPTNGLDPVGIEELRELIAIMIASIWQIPLCLFLIFKIGLFMPLVVNTAFGIFLPGFFGTTSLWWLCPYCWAPKLAESLMGIGINGTLNDTPNVSILPVALSLILSFILFFVLTYVGAGNFSRQEAK